MVTRNSFFILEAKKENNSFYVSNTDPIIWTSDIKNSKCYSTEDRASSDILRDYNNYHAIKNLFDATLSRLYNRKNCFIKNVDSNEKFGR